MNKREANIILKLGNRKVKQVLILTILIIIQPIQQLLRKGTDHGLLIIIDHILKELINELDFEVCQVKACIIIAIKLICKVQNYFITLAPLLWEYELVRHSLAYMLDLPMTRYQTIKFELNLVCSA